MRKRKVVMHRIIVVMLGFLLLVTILINNFANENLNFEPLDRINLTGIEFYEIIDIIENKEFFEIHLIGYENVHENSYNLVWVFYNSDEKEQNCTFEIWFDSFLQVTENHTIERNENVLFRTPVILPHGESNINFVYECD